ncbi:transporter substrate-binding domain-containing protein [Virgibacillus halophilus]|uniref:Transporter substrate-binding domain-containing protein n=1 Tax=Tigheibacillus halophilus TaxID=361280 RepID=A0ABU5CD21_9BACI|nr:transporter substrate-binding domain-containing protein [Virgibacillus halophilus]
MRKLNLAFFIVLLVCALSACGAVKKESAGSSGAKDMPYDLVHADTFTFAASGEFKPFSYVGSDGKMRGFDIAVGNEIAKELGLKPAQEQYKFSAIVEGVKTGRFDAAVASHTITPERAKSVDFSDPYYYSGAQIFVRTDSHIEKLTDLKGKEIGLSKGSTYTSFAEKVTDKIKTYDSDVVALQALEKGHHDAVITDFLTGKEAISNGLKIEGKELIDRSEQAVAVSKDNPELLEAVNKALKKMRENGKLKELSEKYFDADITELPEKD